VNRESSEIDHDDEAERIVRGAAWARARGAAPEAWAGLARPGAGRSESIEGATGVL